MDVDWYHRSWPPAEGDPENVVTEATNMAAVWSSYRRSGPTQVELDELVVETDERDPRSVAIEAGTQVDLLGPLRG